MLAPFWVWPVIAAPFVGSFLGVVVLRARLPQSILIGRSACDSCGQRLGPADLVPLASQADHSATPSAASSIAG